MNSRKIVLGTTAALLIAGAGAWALAQPGTTPQPAAASQPKEGDNKEEVIELGKAPEAVRTAANKLVSDAKNITKVVKEEDDEHVVQYEVEYNEGTVKCSAVFSSAGELMETEKGTTEGKLPAAALGALKKEYPNATFSDHAHVTKMFYEVDVTVNGKKHEVKVNAAGSIEDESEEHEEKAGKGEGKEGHGKEKHGESDKD